MTAQAAPAPATRDYEQWARKVIAEHGQPPRQLRDRIRAIAKAAAARPSP